MPQATADYFRALERCRWAAERADSPEIAALWKTIAESYEVLLAHEEFLAGDRSKRSDLLDSPAG